MRKIISILLVFVLAFGLFGCKKEKAESKQEPCSMQDFMIYRAVDMAQNIGMSAEKNYAQQWLQDENAVNVAANFTEAATDLPQYCKVIGTSNPNITSEVLLLCQQVGAYGMVVGCRNLAYSDEFHFQRILKQTALVFLRYTNGNSFLAIFTPMEDNMIRAYILPLHKSVASQVENRFLKWADPINRADIDKAMDEARKTDLVPAKSGFQVSARYYTEMAKSAFKNIQPLEADDLGYYKVSKEIRTMVTSFSAKLSADFGQTAVYRFPSDAQSQVDTLLAQSSFAEQLTAHTRQREYLDYILNFSGNYGEDFRSANELLCALQSTGSMGIVAQKDETPVIVVLEIDSKWSLLVAIYPTENNIYAYSFAVVPCAFSQVQSDLNTLGCQIMA